MQCRQKHKIYNLSPEKVMQRDITKVKIVKIRHFMTESNDTFGKKSNQHKRLKKLKNGYILNSELKRY